MAELRFNKNLAGVAYKGISQYATIADNSLVVYSGEVNRNGYYAYLTGYYYLDGDVTYLQTTVNNVWLVNVGNTPDWVRTDAVKPKTYTQTQAQRLVDKIIKNNELILQNNLLCARFADRFSSSEKQQIRSLQNRLLARNEALQADGLLKIDSTSYPAGYVEFEPYLAKLMSGESVGVATWVVIVIAATVLTGLGTAVYFAYKSFADESERDVKFSKDLTRTLTEKLTEEEYQQLLDETRGIVTKAKIRTALSSYSKAVVWAGAIIGGAFLYNYVKKKNWL